MSSTAPAKALAAIGGALLAVLIVGGAGFLAGRATAPRPAPLLPAPVVAPPPAAAEPKGALDRSDIIALALQAADAFASGTAMPEPVTKAGGRRFDLVIPFGCAGPGDAAEARAMRWQYDAEQQTLRASALPTTWQPADWGLQDSSAGSARGFWVTRPWSTSSDCPLPADEAAPSGVEPITLPGQTLAIAQFFPDDAARSGWRGDRPFEIAQRMAADRIGDRQGLRLRVTGRIDGSRRGGPVRCIQPGGAEQRPICAVMVQMEEVRIEMPGQGDVLGTWPVDQVR